MLAHALRAASRVPLRQSPTTLRTAPASASTQVWRTYAKYSKPPYGRSNSNDSKPSQTKPATGPARQTSPGTGIPKDQTWQPKDSIKFGSTAGVRAASSQPPEADTQASSAAETEEFNKNATPSANTVPKSQPGPQPSVVNPSDPTPASPRDPEAENEELRGPKTSEVNTEPEAEEKPSGPLPDLRQGIPSTFAKEFGFDKQPSGAESESAKYDLPSDGSEPVGGSGGRRRRVEGGEEEFSQSDYETSTDRARARLARYMYASLVLGVVTGGAYFGRPLERDEEAPSGVDPSDLVGWGPGAILTRIKARMSGSVEYYTEPTSRKLLPDMPAAQAFPFTLVLSLEDLLIHSEWTREHGWRTAKRPGVDYFLRYLSQYYELVVFTTVPSAMGDPVIRKLDPFRVIMWPLFREATKYENGKYVKDLEYLNRPLEKTLIIDTNPDHVRNQPNNAIVLPKWTGNPKDGDAKDLVALIPFLEYIATMNIGDVRKVIESFKDKDIPTEFARREAIAREEFQKQYAQSQGGKPRASVGGFLSSALGVKPMPAPGSLVLGSADGQGQTVSEGLAQGKMLSDQIRERGQREYMRIEEEIRKNGEKWLKEIEEDEKRQIESSMKDMKKGWFGGIVGGGGAAGEVSK
ncbi:Mitochondrial import inner membrane translocase subunit tim50-like protein [Elsinoe fawcettii]|nr:Mitochondrial import inner membrane translocase subunit tim50-like protein [Elsinoe fawcettii]